MTPDRWQKIESVFQKAVDLNPSDRVDFLRAECLDDHELKGEVEKLLSDHDSAESFIEAPVWTDNSFFKDSSARKAISDSLDELTEAETDALIGRQIGVYQLTKELGRGGMGAVYLAERADGEFKQRVAVKLIKRGMDSDFIVRRFRHERQILASFEHPFIARLLDGGTTGDGLPYFVMEFVEGDTLYNFCDKKRLTIRERLEFFRQICSAIQYAHERSIIHRDIKPGNILFTTSGIPKLLDFGIAKILDSELIHESVNPTASMMRLMTPDYASPEQVCGDKVTFSTDIYSLGVLLYELLTGHRPYNFAGRALHEVSRVICEVVPDSPSAILDKKENLLLKYSGAAEKVFDWRRTTKKELRKILALSLDNIVMKALAKEPGERYASAEEFSEDVQRYLSGEIIKAGAFDPKAAFTKKTGDSGQASAKALAVLPFKFLSLAKTEDTGDKFLGVGLADALITRLSKIRSLVVRPTSSILGFEEKGIDPISAARKLDVNYILDGNIKKAGDRLRVTVQLLDVAENSTIWATSIDEIVSDLFSLEDALSVKVVEALLPQLTGGELEEFSKRGTESAEAFEHYLRGRYYFNSGTEEGFAKAFVSFHSAISADPGYAHAYAGIADYYSWLGIYGVLAPQECFQPAIRAAEKAVELDPDLAEAHATLGFAVHAGNYDHPKAVFHLTRSLELNPNYANAYAWFAVVRFTEKRFQEGFILAERAVELDPLTPYNHHNIAWGLYYARRFEESINRYRKVIADFPAYGLSYYGLSKILRFTGATDDAFRQIDNAKNIFGDSIFLTLAEAETFAAAGDTAGALENLAELDKLAAERYVSPYQLALVHCYLKDAEKALERLEEACRINEAWLNWLSVEPVFDFVRNEPRFQKIAEKINKSPTKLIDTDPGNFESETGDLLEAETATYEKGDTRFFSRAFKYAVATMLIVVLGYFIYNIGIHTTVEFSDRTKSWANNFLSEMTLKRLTTSGKSTTGAISPDGKKFAYTVKKEEKQSLWIRSIEDEDNQGREIVAAANVYYSGVAFSPDGKFVYYSTFSSDFKERLLHRVEATGNSESPQRILDHVNSRIDFAPDGKSFAFYSFNPQTRIISLQVAEIRPDDGMILSTKTLAARKQPDFLGGFPSFAPDGKKIVFTEGVMVGKKVAAAVYVFDLETNAETRLVERDFAEIMGASWRKNAGEIVISAIEKLDAPFQLILIKYPSGEISPLTNDLSSYYDPNIARDANLMIAAKRQKMSNLWSVSAGGGGDAEQLTTGENRRDGMGGLAASANGVITYVSGGESDIVMAQINQNGGETHIVKTGVAAPHQLSVTPDGRFIVFNGTKDEEMTLWRFDTATGETSRMPSGFVMTPTITPDGKYVVYAANNSKSRYALHKMPIEGGEAIELTKNLSVSPAVSPDGKYVACYYLSEETGGAWKIAVLPMDAGRGEPVKIIETPDTVNLEPPPMRPLAWSLDNQSIIYVNDKGDFSNLYKIAVAANAKPERITDFTSGRIFDFALTADGKSIVFSKGSSTSDIVMFRKSN